MTNSPSTAGFEQRERVPGASRVLSGLAADVQLVAPQKLSDLRTISAITALTRRGVRIPVAKVLIEDLIERACESLGHHKPPLPVDVHVPRIEGRKEFADEMAKSRVEVVFLSRLDPA